MQLKWPYRWKQTQEQNKTEWASSVGLCQKHKPRHPHHVKVDPRGRKYNETDEQTTATTKRLVSTGFVATFVASRVPPKLPPKPVHEHLKGSLGAPPEQHNTLTEQ